MLPPPLLLMMMLLLLLLMMMLLLLLLLLLLLPGPVPEQVPKVLKTWSGVWWRAWRAPAPMNGCAALR